MSVSFISMSCFFVAWSFCMRLWMFFHKSRCTIIALFLGIFFQEFFIFWTSLGHNKRHINHSKLWGNCMLYFESISCCWAFHFLVEREVSFIIPFLKYFIAVCLFHILRFFDTLICFHSKIIWMYLDFSWYSVCVHKLKYMCMNFYKKCVCYQFNPNLFLFILYQKSEKCLPIKKLLLCVHIHTVNAQ